MEFITRKCNNILDYFVRRTRVEEIAEISTSNVYLEYIFRIISWEDIRYTLKIFLIFNHVYWLILILNLKFYGTLALITLTVFILHNIYYENILAAYKGEHSVMIINECKMYLKEMVKSLKVLRRDSPLTFAAVMSVLFLTTRVISSNISGAALVYVIILMAFFLPLGYKLLPEEKKNEVFQSFTSVIQARYILAEEELIPYISNKDFSKRDPELESLLTDRTADSVTNSLTSGITSMPSYLEVAGEPEDILEEDLMPQQTPRGASCTPGDLSSDSDSERREIKFDSDHFNSSSSEEDAKGLQFSQAVMKHLTATQTDGGSSFSGMALLSNVATMGSSLMANIIAKSGTETSRDKKISSASRKYSSSDSEFELINSDELDG